MLQEGPIGPCSVIPHLTCRPGQSWWWILNNSHLCTQVLPKLSSSIIHEIDSILGNKPYSKKDYRS